MEYELKLSKDAMTFVLLHTLLGLAERNLLDPQEVSQINGRLNLIENNAIATQEELKTMYV